VCDDDARGDDVNERPPAAPREVVTFYKAHNPDKVADASRVVAQWRGREHQLLALLHEKCVAVSPVLIASDVVMTAAECRERWPQQHRRRRDRVVVVGVFLRAPFVSSRIWVATTAPLARGGGRRAAGELRCRR
jgi:hypothetical protein